MAEEEEKIEVEGAILESFKSGIHKFVLATDTKYRPGGRPVSRARCSA